MKEMTDLHLHIPTFSGEYGPVEDVFTIVGHLIYSYLKMNRRQKKSVTDLFQHEIVETECFTREKFHS